MVDITDIRQVGKGCNKRISEFAQALARSSFTQKGLSLSLAATIALTTIGFVQPADAQGRKIRLVRDAETEELIRDYAKPIFKAAGLKPRNVRIHLINDSRFNAFVVDSKRMFINTGTLVTAQTPNEVIGVIAHETGHIAGGHLVRLRQALREAQTIAAITMLLGVGAAVAGAATRRDGAAQAGTAIASSAPVLAQRTFLSYARTEEIAADRAAYRYLERTGQSTKGMLTTFSRFANQTMFSGAHIDPYLQSHPLPRDRISQLERLAKKSRNYNKKDSKSLSYRHAMVKAKLAAFTQNAKRVMRKYKGNDLPSQYARAITTYRLGNHRKALKLVDALLRSQPNNAYFWELKGQILLETGAGAKAITPLNKAVALKPNVSLFRVMLGQAIISSGNRANYKQAITHLRRGLQKDPDIAVAYRFLAQAYDAIGNRAEAELATANGYFASGQIGAAKSLATRAKKKLKRGSPSWLQAEDILLYKKPKI
ncbi:M48 family metalloprotease [Cohaesibacter gelatinilyticus]|uniref:Putative Zn-dependent protease, contains TPR repeats n=1 Tax=Cohaesibacter gelatinilyticus TaxID=372072 RepID=A0A285NEY1_9HYPH|nr:M48 family metalloprotease [Cohaesibacter gelatinilyticus]SNZ08009.1 Putative Zn-dependent protease, contains TPR repeats [Cohaesibacter gelatinilyticus]HAT85907.1 M48 family peptidase [Hyphomicrobiales bacterium]